MESKNIKQRLTNADYEKIFALHEQGVSVAKISELFKVTRPTIYNVLEKVRKDQTKKEFFIDSDEEDTVTLNLPKTVFLGITIDAENGSSDPRINKALNKSLDLLDITEFIKVTKFKLNMVMFDYFWQVVVGNTRVHLSSALLEWFGYEGEVKDQKRAFTKMLKRNGISFNELSQHDKEIELYPTIKEELQLLPSNVTNTRFILMEPKDLKMAIMQLKTKNGHIIRQYYVDLEELLKIYTEYTLYFNHRKSQIKITSLEESMAKLNLMIAKQEEDRKQDKQLILQQVQYMRSLGISLEEVKDQNHGLKHEVKKVQRKLGIAVEDRAPLPVDERRQERFILVKRNDPDYMTYYTIRAQHAYTENKLKTQRLLFERMEVLLDFVANPNSKTLYVRIKDTLKAKGVTFSGNNIDIEGSNVTEDQLVDEMRVINDQKYTV